METSKLLEEREKTHGNYYEHSGMSQRLKIIMADGVNQECLTHCQSEALDMIAHKIARILSGDPHHLDHWRDISGYAELVVREMEKIPDVGITEGKSDDWSE